MSIAMTNLCCAAAQIILGTAKSTLRSFCSEAGDPVIPNSRPCLRAVSLPRTH